MPRIRVELQQRWADLDAYRHVNNVTYARYFEEARIRVFSDGGSTEKTGLEGLFKDDTDEGMKMVVGSQTIDFIRPLAYHQEPVIVELWIGRLGGSSFDLNAELIVGEDRLVYARCSTTAVLVDGVTMRPMRLPAEAREAAARWVGEPLKLGRVSR